MSSTIAPTFAPTVPTDFETQGQPQVANPGTDVNMFSIETGIIAGGVLMLCVAFVIFFKAFRRSKQDVPGDLEDPIMNAKETSRVSFIERHKPSMRQYKRPSAHFSLSVDGLPRIPERRTGGSGFVIPKLKLGDIKESAHSPRAQDYPQDAKAVERLRTSRSSVPLKIVSNALLDSPFLDEDLEDHHLPKRDSGLSAPWLQTPSKNTFINVEPWSGVGKPTLAQRIQDSSPQGWESPNSMATSFKLETTTGDERETEFSDWPSVNGKKQKIMTPTVVLGVHLNHSNNKSPGDKPFLSDGEMHHLRSPIDKPFVSDGELKPIVRSPCDKAFISDNELRAPSADDFLTGPSGLSEDDPATVHFHVPLSRENTWISDGDDEPQPSANENSPRQRRGSWVSEDEADSCLAEDETDAKEIVKLETKSPRRGSWVSEDETDTKEIDKLEKEQLDNLSSNPEWKPARKGSVL